MSKVETKLEVVTNSTPFVTERYWTDDKQVDIKERHSTIDDALEYIKKVETNDPDDRFSWNLFEMTFYKIP